METVFITGGNRGIGLEFVRQMLAQGTRVFATCRNPQGADALQALAQQYPDTLTIFALDVSNAEEIESVAAQVQQHTKHIDVLINNAGTNPKIPEALAFGTLTHQAMSDVLLTNSVSPLIVTQAFIRLLSEGNNPRVMMISSEVGSIARRTNGGSYAYRMSKTALNMATRILSFDLKPRGITAVTVHPGWVQTDMGGPNAPITPDVSVTGLLAILARLTLEDAGSYLNYTGEVLPW